MTIREIEYHRARWGDGPWHGEPNKVEFTHAGLVCFMRRIIRGGGHWSGYVLLPASHPAHGREAGDLRLVAAVHGGITYTEPTAGHWCVGFDCGHFEDITPIRPHGFSYINDARYWTVAMVRRETERLAEQLAAICQAHAAAEIIDEEQEYDD